MIIEFYLSPDNQWRWRARAVNGRVIADGAEGYATRRGVRRAIRTFLQLVFKNVRIVEVAA